jgi:hypothetical protein
MQIYHGVLEGLSDQGMEGLIEYTFWPDNHAELNLTFPILLQTGDELKITDSDGRIVWQGTVEFVPRRYPWLWWGDNARRNDLLHATNKQKNVTYADWLNWFCDKPQLRAELKRKD